MLSQSGIRHINIYTALQLQWIGGGKRVARGITSSFMHTQTHTHKAYMYASRGIG